jgi:hypothetical protein
VVKYSPQLEEAFHRRKRSVWVSWRMDLQLFQVQMTQEISGKGAELFGRFDQPVQHGVRIDLKDPSRRADPQTLSQAGQDAHDEIDLGLFAVKHRTVMLGKKGVARGAMDLTPGATTRMPIGPQVVQSQPAAIVTVTVRAEVHCSVHGTGAAVRWRHGSGRCGAAGVLSVVEPQFSPRPQDLAPFRPLPPLGPGETEALALYVREQADAIVSDDRGFLHVLAAHQIPFLTPAAVVVALCEWGLLTVQGAQEALGVLRPLIRLEQYHTARADLDTLERRGRV